VEDWVVWEKIRVMWGLHTLYLFLPAGHVAMGIVLVGVDDNV